MVGCGVPLPKSLFSDITLAVWNQPRWEYWYMHHENQGFSPAFPKLLIKHLPTHTTFPPCIPECQGMTALCTFSYADLSLQGRGVGDPSPPQGTSVYHAHISLHPRAGRHTKARCSRSWTSVPWSWITCPPWTLLGEKCLDSPKAGPLLAHVKVWLQSLLFLGNSEPSWEG